MVEVEWRLNVLDIIAIVIAIIAITVSVILAIYASHIKGHLETVNGHLTDIKEIHKAQNGASPDQTDA
ncbi:Hypothetical protein POVN_LOCUS554 [uncultured virus]|nr:Hypothetical protein POVN_LOCUS554 [uncultured virus]